MARQTVVNVRHDAAIHNSGTKFYEIFLFENEFGAFFINRYGKVSQLNTGGQEGFDALTPTSGDQAYESKLRQKFSQKGGYTEGVRWNLAGDPAAVLRDRTAPDFQCRFDMTEEYDSSALKASIRSIFGNDDAFNQMCEALNLPGPGDLETIKVPEFEEVSAEERAADETWGAW